MALFSKGIFNVHFIFKRTTGITTGAGKLKGKNDITSHEYDLGPIT